MKQKLKTSGACLIILLVTILVLAYLSLGVLLRSAGVSTPTYHATCCSTSFPTEQYIILSSDVVRSQQTYLPSPPLPSSVFSSNTSRGEPELSWSATSNRIYVNGGCATISDLLNYRLDGNGKQKGPIWHFDDVRRKRTKYWCSVTIQSR